MPKWARTACAFDPGRVHHEASKSRISLSLSVKSIYTLACQRDGSDASTLALLALTMSQAHRSSVDRFGRCGAAGSADDL